MTFVERRGPGTIVVLFGAPGSGKGTQAQFMSETFHLAHISTGEMLRAAVDSGSALGREVGPIMATGALVPDDLVVRVIEERLRQPDAKRGVLLDGFPRTVHQAQALDAMLERQGRGVDIVLCLEVPRELLVRRILKRADEEDRVDDTPEAVQKRMEVYEGETAPVLDYYSERPGTRVIVIDGVGSVEEVRGRIRNALASALRRSIGEGAA